MEQMFPLMWKKKPMCKVHMGLSFSSLASLFSFFFLWFLTFSVYPSISIFFWMLIVFDPLACVFFLEVSIHNFFN